MESLNRAFLAKNPQIKDVKIGSLRTDMPEKIVQFGEGNFLRAFVTWMINALNANNLFNGRVVVVQPLNQGLADMLNKQDGVYTLIMRGMEDGVAQERKEIITAVSRALNPYADWQGLMNCARNPEMRFMISNTTEAGIAYLKEDFPVNACPTSFPAKVCAFLYERFKTFNGAPDKGMVMICCELIEHNADKLKEIVNQLAAEWNLGADFIKWLNASCIFCSTLVDRIVPGYPRDIATEICQQLGYQDNLLDTCELFHLWVIEGPQSVAEELPFTKLGLHVVWTDDMTPYRTRKVRMLNGAHTSSVLGAYLAGLNTVGEMLNDELFQKYVKSVLLDEILPQVPGEFESNKSFALSILDRFSNPYVKHALLSISLNSVSKWKVRVLPSLKDFVAKYNKLPQLLASSLASLMAFYRGVRAGEAELKGDRAGEAYAIKDGVNELAYFEKAWADFAANKDVKALVSATLAKTEFWGEDLNQIAGMTDFVAAKLESILANGSRATIAEMLK